MSSVTLRQLFEAGVYFGHQTRFREPKMSPYIYGKRNKVSIINLEMTKSMLQEAADFAGKISARPGGKLLFVGTKRAAREVIKAQASRCSMPYVDHRWLGGLLTNYRTIRQSIKRLKELEVMSRDGSFNRLTKKEAGRLQRDMTKLEQAVGGIKDMGGLPDALFIIDVGYEHIAVSEAQKLKIPIIGVVDTNHLPDGIDYVIPGNDDATRSILLYATVLADAVVAGRASNTTGVIFASSKSLEEPPELAKSNVDDLTLDSEEV